MHYAPRFVQTVHSQGFRVEEFFVKRPTGDAAAILVSPESSQKPPVVVLHSTGCDRFTPLTHLYLNLLEHGFPVIAFDLDGHGKESTHIFDKEAILNDSRSSSPSMISSVLKAATDKLACSEVILLGQSLGGTLALDYALSPSGDGELPKIAKLVCIGSPLEVQPSRISAFKELSSLFQPSVKKAWKHFGAAGTIPAIGSFRRSLFPIRVTDHRPYPKEVMGLINSLGLKERSQELETPCLWISSKWDTIAQGGMPQGATPLTFDRESHFSLLYTDRFFAELNVFLQG